MSVLSLEQLTVGYAESPVLRGVDLVVQPRELVAVLGPNGAGKSTLIKTALGLLAPSSGRVGVLGTPLDARSRQELARCVAWVPQEVDALADFTALELVLLGRSPHLGFWGVPSARDEALALAALDSLGLAPLAARPLSALSGGERRLVLLARALAQEPALLLLDEPTAFLDLRHQLQALVRVRDFVRAGGAAVAVLHDINLAAAFADRVLLLKEGRVRACGPAREVLESEALDALYDIEMVRARALDDQLLFAPRATR